MTFAELAKKIDEMSPYERNKLVFIGHKIDGAGMEYIPLKLIQDMFGENTLVHD